MDPTPPEGSLDGKDPGPHRLQKRILSTNGTGTTTDASLRNIERASWAEEMEILQPKEKRTFM